MQNGGGCGLWSAVTGAVVAGVNSLVGWPPVDGGKAGRVRGVTIPGFSGIGIESILESIPVLESTPVQ